MFIGEGNGESARVAWEAVDPDWSKRLESLRDMTLVRDTQEDAAKADWLAFSRAREGNGPQAAEAALPFLTAALG